MWPGFSFWKLLESFLCSQCFDILRPCAWESEAETAIGPSKIMSSFHGAEWFQGSLCPALCGISQHLCILEEPGTSSLQGKECECNWCAGSHGGGIKGRDWGSGWETGIRLVLGWPVSEKVYVPISTLAPVSSPHIPPASARSLLTGSDLSERTDSCLAHTSLSQGSQVAILSTLISCLSFNHCAFSKKLSESFSAVLFIFMNYISFPPLTVILVGFGSVLVS